MSSMSKSLFVMAVVLLSGSLIAVQALPAQTESFEGELVQVNVEARTIQVRGDAEAMEFAYSEQTEITGSEQGIQGLAESPGTRVRVHYTGEETKNAMRIEVLADDGGDDR